MNAQCRWIVTQARRGARIPPLQISNEHPQPPFGFSGISCLLECRPVRPFQVLALLDVAEWQFGQHIAQFVDLVPTSA